jgi:hypothetical protein
MREQVLQALSPGLRFASSGLRFCTDRRHHLAAAIKGLDEAQSLAVDAQQIGIDLAARKHDGIVVLGARLGERPVDGNRLPPVLDGAITWTIAPASRSRSRGISSSACSNPWVARIAILFPSIFIWVLSDRLEGHTEEINLPQPGFLDACAFSRADANQLPIIDRKELSH